MAKTLKKKRANKAKKPAAKMVTVMGHRVRSGTKKHKALTQRKRQYDDLLRSETSRKNKARGGVEKPTRKGKKYKRARLAEMIRESAPKKKNAAARKLPKGWVKASAVRVVRRGGRVQLQIKK